MVIINTSHRKSIIDTPLTTEEVLPRIRDEVGAGVVCVPPGVTEESVVRFRNISWEPVHDGSVEAPYWVGHGPLEGWREDVDSEDLARGGLEVVCLLRPHAELPSSVEHSCGGRGEGYRLQQCCYGLQLTQVGGGVVQRGPGGGHLHALAAAGDTPTDLNT